jgi:hypothetical protein
MGRDVPHGNRDLGRAVRDLMAHRPGKTYTAVRTELEAAEAECPECGDDTRTGYDCHCDDL